MFTEGGGLCELYSSWQRWLCSGLVWARVRYQLKWGAKTEPGLPILCSSLPPYPTTTTITTTHPPSYRPGWATSCHQSWAELNIVILLGSPVQWWRYLYLTDRQSCISITVSYQGEAKSSTSQDFYCWFIIVLLRVKPREVMGGDDTPLQFLQLTEINKTENHLISDYTLAKKNSTLLLNVFLWWTP